MPRPRHPIREHFHEVGSDKRIRTIACNYCNKEQSAGNPKRCQKHLDECAHYAQALAAHENGETTAFPFHSPFESPAQGQNTTPAQSSAAARSQDHFQNVDDSNNFAASPTPTTNANLTPSSQGGQNMSEETIKRTLGLDEMTYTGIERDLDTHMMALNLSGAGLHTASGLKLLRQAFAHIKHDHGHRMKPVPEAENTACLTSMAYICNRKRRNGQPPNSSLATPPSTNVQRKAVAQLAQRAHLSAMSPTGSPASPPTAARDNQVQGPPQPFGHCTIIAERAEPKGNGAFVVCRPSDLIEEPKPHDEITVDDVKFMPFIDLLQHDEDVLFNAANDDRIMFTFTGGRTKTVSNEVVWRVALEDMHKKGLNEYVFKIYKRQQRAM